MNIKGLLISSAAAVVAVSGAQAADAIVIAEPEPMEYVRICDTYGTGFFYIPGTENCLKIGGYVRYQMEYKDPSGARSEFAKLARFALQFDVRNSTEWGTLRSFAQVNFNWASLAAAGALTPYENATGTGLEHAYISLENGANSFLIGKTDTPFYDFLGYWAGPTILEGSYGGTNTGQVRYTYDGGNGFGAVLAVVQNDSTTFEPNFEAGAKFAQDWGWLAGVIGYDSDANDFGARVGIGANFTSNFSAHVQVLYSNDTNSLHSYSVRDAIWNSGTSVEWSALVGASATLNDKLALNGHFQWFDNDEWNGAINAAWTPVNGLTITPEVGYYSSTETTYGIVRFQRNF